MLHKSTILLIILSAYISITTINIAKADVVASLKPLGFIASAITDGVIATHVLLSDNISDHDYSLRPSDVRRLYHADLVVSIGPEIEIFMSRLISKLIEKKQVHILSLEGIKSFLIKKSNNIEENHKKNDNSFFYVKEKSNAYHYSNEYDMHLWLSPDIARLSATAIHDKLVELMPYDKNKLDSNLEDFRIKLNKADYEITNKLARLKGRGYYVFHDAYRYYEKHYGLTPLGCLTFNANVQPGAKSLYEMKTQLFQQKAVCVFSELQFRSSLIKSITKGTSVRIGILDPVGSNIKLSKDSYIVFLNQLADQYENCLKASQ